MADCLLRKKTWDTYTTYNSHKTKVGEIPKTLKDPLSASSIPIIPGCDIIGTVLKCSTITYCDSSISEGDTVVDLNRELGGNARFILVPHSKIICINPKPKPVNGGGITLTPPQPSKTSDACNLAYLPAFQCLYRVGNNSAQPGDRVLIADATTNTGNAAVKLALVAGATVHATTHPQFHSKLTNGGEGCVWRGWGLALDPTCV